MCGCSMARTRPEQAQAFAASHARVTLVPRSGQGPNALDFHVAFYLGYWAAKHPDAELVVVANERDYDPMLAHARMIKFRARRVGYKAPAAKEAAAAKPAAPVAVPVAAKKAAAKKTVAPKALAKQAVPKPAAPAKAVAAKKAPTAKKLPTAKKSMAKKSRRTQTSQSRANGQMARASSCAPSKPRCQGLCQNSEGLDENG
jgi:hypothetical protein